MNDQEFIDALWQRYRAMMKERSLRLEEVKQIQEKIREDHPVISAVFTLLVHLGEVQNSEQILKEVETK